MGMKIGVFRRLVGKTLAVKPVKLALRTVARNTARTQTAQHAVALKVSTGHLVQTLSQYLLGVQTTQEMKEASVPVMGDLGYELVALARVLKVKLPSSTKKAKLVGTRAAALLQLDSLATDLLSVVQEGVFQGPPMTTVTKQVTMPNKGGVKEERQIEVVDAEADAQHEADRRTEMQSFLSGAVDVYWRLNFDLYGQPPVYVLEQKFKAMQQAYPVGTFDEKPKAPKLVKKAVAKAKKAKPAEPVSV